MNILKKITQKGEKASKKEKMMVAKQQKISKDLNVNEHSNEIVNPQKERSVSVSAKAHEMKKIVEFEGKRYIRRNATFEQTPGETHDELVIYVIEKHIRDFWSKDKEFNELYIVIFYYSTIATIM